MVVQHNITAMNANRYFGINNKKLSKSLEKLSSGYAINRAGDNAAGLAVSEKMRSQIAGMTQAVKNAQDGISMVQTYEGALTETDSILQRMKTLATQMANGGYDDPVDRTAAQQEFYQLNDELNQIADTDYNGVVVLNGGVMADGVKADANGLIDYEAAKKAAEEAAAKEPVDFGGSDLFNTVDDIKYNKAAANALWSALDLNGDTESVDITFTLDANGVWNATAASQKGANGDLTKVTTSALNNTDRSGKGGFGVKVEAIVDNEIEEVNGSKTTAAAVTGDVTNVIFDETNAKAGDTITLTFTRSSVSNYAPENIGFENASGTKSKAFASQYSVDASSSTITLDADIKDDKMNALMQEALEKLQGLKIRVGYGNVAGQADTDATGAGNATAGAAKYAIQNAADLEKLGFKFEADAGDTSGKTFNITYEDKEGHTLKVGQFVAAENTITVDSHAKAGSGAGMDLTDEKTSGSYIEFEIRLDAFQYVGEDDSAFSVNAKKPESEEDYAVSKSNAFNHSEAKMTYKDHLILQVGGRTKDAVDFTFKYDSDSIGDLAADLNCTAKGLGTDVLDIKTQESANYAIDKIDQALNKVSLVRGTFGAIQNRLDHKIDNLNVTVENLTDAESRIRDTNMAEEMMNFTKNQILSQASQSMLAQANQLPQSVLQLLQ